MGPLSEALFIITRGKENKRKFYQLETNQYTSRSHITPPKMATSDN